METSPNGDINAAIRYAQSLGGGLVTPQRAAALTTLLIEKFGTSSQRLRAARAELARTAEADSWEEDAIGLIDSALDLLKATGVTTTDDEQAFAARLHAECYPEPQPFEWNRNRRSDPAWQLRQASLAKAELRHETAFRSGLLQIAIIHIGDIPAGKVKYFICDPCTIGLIGNIEIDVDYQGFGIGEQVITSLHQRRPRHCWHTSAQYDTSATFWPKIATLTGADFTFAEQCPHMTMR